MRISAGIDFSGLSGGLDDLARQIEEAADVGVQAVAERGVEIKRSTVSVLTGAWRDGQQIENDGPAQRRIVDTGPAAEPITNYPGGYAQRVSETSNPAAEKAHAILERETQGIFEEAAGRYLESQRG